MARVTDDLIGAARDSSVDRGRPVPLRGLAEHNHRPAIRRVPILHRLQHTQDRLIVVTARQRQQIPSVRRPLIRQPVSVELAVYHAADQRVVYPGVVVREKNPEPLARLQRDGLSLQLLGVTGAHGEFAFERDDLRRAHRRADDVPEGGLAGRGRNAHTRRSAVDVVGDVGRFDVPGERPDPATLGLREQRIVDEIVIGEEVLQRAGAPAEAQRIDRQHREIGRDVVPAIACCLIFSRERLAHDHPQGVTRRRAVTGGEHELVAVGMLGAAVIEAEPSPVGAGQMCRDIERRVCQGPAKMSRLGVVAQEHERHAGHEAHVFQLSEIARRSLGDVALHTH